MKIIFVRHGIAEDMSEDGSDFTRRLLPEHLKELKKDLRNLKLYLYGKNPVIMSSGKLRALETAELLSENSEFSEIVLKEYIETEDTEKFIEDMRSMMEEDSDATPVIVGHVPSLDEWIFMMTDSVTDMSKGSACETELTDPESFRGKLNWYLEENELKNLLKDQELTEKLMTLKREIDDRSDQCIDDIFKFREIYLNDPKEIEGVHKLRVKIRQYRSFISLMKPLLRKEDYVYLQDNFRSLAQDCAYLRELDVLIREWGSLREEFEKAGLSGDNFLSIMKLEREKEENILADKLETPWYAVNLKQLSERFKASCDVRKTDYLTLESYRDHTMDRWREEIRSGYEAIDKNDLTIIHALRIKAKKMRYVYEIFGLDKDKKTSDGYKEIRKWQEVLGDITDANRNSDAVTEIEMKYPEADIKSETEFFKSVQKIRAEKLYEDFFKA